MVEDLNYSALDRLLHRVAFSLPQLQVTLAEIEDAMFAGAYRHVDAGRPIFITSLPRAGTTILLEALNRLPGLATHTYRNMPFVLSPILWGKLSRRFRKQTALRQRAHGDGLQIGLDSPEAFEEVIWRSLFPDKYTSSQIPLWKAHETSKEAAAFFVSQMRKIVATRLGATGRYVSKNNGNIARLDLLPALFPDAAIVVPLRRPLNHAASLLRQHRNFLDQHARDTFRRRYMADIGHFEFGALHRPIAFPGLGERLQGRDPLTIDYWLSYWVAAFEHVLDRADGLVLLAHDVACAAPLRILQQLCEILDIEEDGAVESAAALYARDAAPDFENPPDVDKKLLSGANDLYERLRARSLGASFRT